MLHLFFSLIRLRYWGLSDPVPLRRVSDLGFVALSPSDLTVVKSLLLEVVYSNGLPVLPELAKGCDGVVGSNKVNDACGICDGDNSTCCNGTPEQIAVYCFPCQYAPDHPPYVVPQSVEVLTKVQVFVEFL